MSRVEIATLLVGARVKEGKGGGEGRGFSLPAPSPAPFDSPLFLLSFGVYTWRFHNQKHSHA